MEEPPVTQRRHTISARVLDNTFKLLAQSAGQISGGNGKSMQRARSTQCSHIITQPIRDWTPANTQELNDLKIRVDGNLVVPTKEKGRTAEQEGQSRVCEL